MRKPLHRRRVGGMPCMLLALLVLFARLVAPVMAMPPATSPTASPAGPGVAALAAFAICHAGPADDAADGATGEPGLKHETPPADCLLCPVCHIAGQALFPAPGGPAMEPPGLLGVSLAAPLPPATAPPARPRAAAPPAGPPPHPI